jgi:hypothetical protein
MEGHRDYRQLVRGALRERQEGHQATHCYWLGTPLSTQAASLSDPMNCPCSSRRSPSTRSSRKGTSGSTLVLFATSRPQRIRRQGVPNHRGGQLDPPPDAVIQYAAQHTDNNSIGARGCEYLQQGHWGTLQELWLGNPAITKAATKSGTWPAATSARCSWGSLPVFTSVVMV